FPSMYEAFVNACQANLKTKTKGFISKAQVHYINYDVETMQYKTTGNAVLNEKADLLQNVIEIYKNDVRIGAKMNVYHNSQYSYLACETDNMEHYKNDNIKVVVTAVWRTKNNVLKACTLSDVLLLSEYDYIDKFTNLHPMKQPNISPKHRITVTYAREPKNETYDYIFPESRISSGEENVSLNIEGDITLKADWQYDSLENYEITMWSIERGVIEYQGTEPIITTNNNGFHYKFPVKKDKKGREYCEWNDYIEDSVRYGNQDYDYNCKMIFKVKNKKTNATEKQCIEVTTLDVPHKPVNTEFIPMLRLCWGCIGEESMVLMADGSLRRIEDIRIGDYIYTPESIKQVRNVYKGYEEMILHLETKAGKTLNLCLNHPLLTTEGYIPARDLTSKSQLITYDGNIDYVNFAYEIEYKKCVYSLEVDAGGFYAENLVVGTFETENSSLNQNQLETTNLTQEQKDELEMLKEAFENGKIFR
ncbi:MAG: Hint domain-containing protein, partial [Coprobacillus sp.]